LELTRGRSALAVVVLAVAAWLFLKLALNVVAAAVAGTLLVVAVLWALQHLALLGRR
jgi:hypothetical protein